jgi:hypothetical protein
MSGPRIVIVLGLAAGGCIPQTVSIPESAQPTTTPASLDYGPYALVLNRAVESGGVNYDAILADPSPLQRFLATLARVGPTSTPELFRQRSDRVAYWINAHNACVLYAIIGQARAGQVPQNPPRDPATGFRFLVDGRWQTPAELARAALRESEDDWRVAMALCGGRRSDPPIARVPFIGDVLEYQLTRHVVDNLDSPAVLRVDAGMQYLYLHRIICDAQPRLVADYQRRTGARHATILNVLIDMADRDQYPLLNSAVGYPVRPLGTNRTINASVGEPTQSPGLLSRILGG